VQVAGAAYVDGGVHSPSNADVLTGDRPDLVLVLSPMSLGRGTVRRPRPDLALRMGVRRYLSREARTLRRAGAEVVVLQPGPQDLPAMGLNPMQHSRVEDALRVAADSTRARLESQPALVELLAGG
jgi:NTE family protein